MRIFRVDAAEIRDACETARQSPINAWDSVRDLLIDESVLLGYIENDKFGGRLLAYARFYDLLIANGHAREYHGGTCEGSCGEASELLAVVAET